MHNTLGDAALTNISGETNYSYDFCAVSKTKVLPAPFFSLGYVFSMFLSLGFFQRHIRIKKDFI